MNYDFRNISAIRSAITLLVRRVGIDGIKSFGIWHPPKDYSSISSAQDYANQCSALLLIHYKIYDIKVDISFEEIDRPAYVLLTNLKFIKIIINKIYENSFIEIPAILSHEIAHIFLHHTNIGFPDTYSNEILTDVTCIYLGSGWQALNLHKIDSKFDHNREIVTTRTYGYLGPEEFGYVIAKRDFINENKMSSLIYGQDAKIAYNIGFQFAKNESHSPPLIRPSFTRRIMYQIQKFNSRVLNNSINISCIPGEFYYFDGGAQFVTFRCPTCTQRLRLPTGKKLKAHCPACRTEILVKT